MDVAALRRRWPKDVFRTLYRRAPDVELLRRDARKRSDWAFRYSGPGYCSVCEERVHTALDSHIIAFHLELAQLWRCPVEWCTVWKGSVCQCLKHLAEKHGGSTFVAMENVEKFFLPWTVTRGVWLHALRPDVSGIAVDTLLFTRREDDWCIATGSTGTRFLTRHSGTALLPACFPAWSGPWPSPSLLI